ELQPAIQWLGLEIIWYVVFEYAETPSPERIEAAIKAMEGSDIIVVIGLAGHHGHEHGHHGHEHELMSKLDERLKDEAENRGLKVLGVAPGYVGGSIIESLHDIIEHLKMKGIKGC
ncbi:MAG: hypothetical protein ACK4H7_03185, partial [Acidilobaceae archaeon]